ncbi:response regulator transcription factor [Amycolatopsis thermalba]|uniref:Response regulator transcription factor n=1 Tax=Amycolatopsis thermalba TaxID=944492 RepID=A0ABY4NPY3_9PSEU|nr:MULTISPECIES: response regulator transcription factor [Amycolatopsis]UQS22010.1 response regulator transcription factor [Amycolatopsis thermalba]
MTAIRVFVADDQEVVRRNLRHILEAEDDLEVIGEAADGESAVKRARELRPDVLLVDVRMPGRDGLSVTRVLAGPDVVDPLRVIVITTFELDDYARAAIQNGACGFLLKRSGPGLLVEGVRAAVSGDMLISPQMTLRLFRHMGRPAVGSRRPGVLSGREWEIVRLVSQARTNAEIAQSLGITVGTVKTHLRSIQRKLDLRNRVAIAAWGWETSVKGA